MKAIIKPAFINGTIRIPASKSIMQRACAAALLHKGITTIHNPGFSDDEHAVLQIIQQLGATILSKTEQEIVIKSRGFFPKSNNIYCGESGLAARLFIPIAALSKETICIDGNGSLLQRPMQEFIAVLPQLGVSVQHQDNYLPFNIKGPLQLKEIEVDGSMSSQFLTGLLFAYSFAATKHMTIKVQSLKSRPYIDLTLQMLQYFGKEIIHDNYETFYIKPSDFIPKEAVEIHVESDWSSTAFWLVGAAINGNISVENLIEQSLQADKNILNAIEAAIGNPIRSLKYFSQQPLIAFQFDATNCPDLFPILSVMAGCAKGTSTIKGVHRLIHKESNRRNSIIEMLQQLGVHSFVVDDCLAIEGRESFESATIQAYNDHRIVMAAAIAALKASAPITILGAEAVSKSYPNFFQHLASLGIECDLSS
jgi:3-phosphoshikimate 1-carboxyvinyltransferase